MWKSIIDVFCPFLSLPSLVIINAGNVKSGENQPPFKKEGYSAAFKRGNMVKGILCPSLTNSFRARELEQSYLTYSHRQRQKSLLIVNIVDLMLKLVLAVVWTCRKSTEFVCVFIFIINTNLP